MRLDPPGSGHLTYCTNVHPGESWEDVRRCLATEVAAVKARFAPGRRFGVGLRLSAAAAAALAEPERLAELRAMLADGGLYGFTLNGFPYGHFHGGPVKEAVYRPDWRSPDRLAYSNRLADILAALLEDGAEGERGSISTVPGCFRAAVAEAPLELMVEHLLRHVAYLVDLHRRTGRIIVLALEPEPCCLLETIGEAIGFLEERVLSRGGLDRLAALTGLGAGGVEEAARRHLGLCLDACHAAVVFDDAVANVTAAEAAGIAIAKLQVSVAARIPEATPERISALTGFDDKVYLHQVFERVFGHGTAGRRSFADLPEALAAAPPEPGAEWRVHVHLPVFADFGDGPVATTRPDLEALLERQRRRPFTHHLEVETYTWGVLPPSWRAADLPAAIARELAWTMERLT